jgi:hypothetical protein
MAADEVPMARVPDLGAAAQSKAFVDAITRVGRWTGAKPIASKIAGIVEFEVIGTRAQKLLTQRQGELLKKGIYLLVSRRGIAQDDAWTLWLVASPRWEDVVAAARTNGSNIDVGSRKIISQLKIIEKQNPFVVMGAGPDFVQGRFVGQVNDAAALAKRIAKLSPDIVSQGTDTIERLEELLVRDSQFMLWWD